MTDQVALVLHSYRRCPFAIRVRMVLEEKGLSYTVIEEKLSDLSPELLRLHPEGRVPLLIHQLAGAAEVIYESSVITEYLEEAFPQRRLMPDSPAERARVRLWTYWCNEILKPDLDLFKYEWREMSESAQRELASRIKGHLVKMDDSLEIQPYLMGQELSLADIHLFPFYRQLSKAHSEFDSLFPSVHLNDWLARIIARPSFDRTMTKTPFVSVSA